MKRFFVYLLCIGVVLAGVGVTVALYVSRPQAVEKPNEKISPLVEVMAVNAADVELKLPSQGLIEAKHNTTLAAEVGGKIVEISDKFEAGGEFEKDEVILEIDAADYQAALAQSKSNLEEARMSLVSEEARATQAERDWKALGNGEPASELSLRKPQLASARAKISAAEAAVEKSERDLERTKLRAPFAARVNMTHADLGGFVNTGSPLLEIHSLGPYEVRLPLSLDEFAFVEQDASGNIRSNAALTAEAAGKSFQWSAAVVRTEGQVDRSSRSIYLVAKVEAKDGDGGTALLQPGLFVAAEVEGITLKNVFRVPMQAFRELDTVVVVSDDNKLYFRKVKVDWRDAGEALVSSGLKDGERVLMTEIPDVVEQMLVRIADPKVEDQKGKGDGAPEAPLEATLAIDGESEKIDPAAKKKLKP